MIELLWIRNVERRPVKVPHALLSSAPPKVIADWRRRNTFLDNVPLTLFGDSTLSPFGDVFNDFPADPIPWRVENAPAQARDTWNALRGSFPELSRNERAWEIYKIAVRNVARHVAPAGAPVWVIGADDDQGLLAVVAAHERGGMVAAIAGGDIGLIGASCAAELNVNVGVVEKTMR